MRWKRCLLAQPQRFELPHQSYITITNLLQYSALECIDNAFCIPMHHCILGRVNEHGCMLAALAAHTACCHGHPKIQHRFAQRGRNIWNERESRISVRRLQLRTLVFGNKSDDVQPVDGIFCFVERSAAKYLFGTEISSAARQIDDEIPRIEVFRQRRIDEEVGKGGSRITHIRRLRQVCQQLYDQLVDLGPFIGLRMRIWAGLVGLVVDDQDWTSAKHLRPCTREPFVEALKPTAVLLDDAQHLRGMFFREE
ncbi:hypothetical protein D3C87_1289740 [compost metagenome]